MILELDNRRALRAVKAAEKKAPRKRFSPFNLNTLEYSIIANLVLQNYQHEGSVKFDALLSIPLRERIPGLIEAYGKKNNAPLAGNDFDAVQQQAAAAARQKLNDTRISMTACELMIEAEEDQLSLEDVILFLQRAQAGLYGPIRSLIVSSVLFDKFEMYRQTRHDAFVKKRDERDAAFKIMGAVPRATGEPVAIGDLLQQSFIFDVHNRA